MPFCPRCGFQNLAESRFCQSCGSPLQIQTTPPPRYYTPQPPRSSGSETAIILAVVLIIVILGATAAIAFFIYTPAFNVSRVIPRPGPVTVTGVFLTIQYPNQTKTGWYGTAYRFIGNPLLYLQHNQIQQISFALFSNSTTGSHTVDTITVAYSGGFNIQSVSPTLPYTTHPGSSTTFTTTLQAPSTDYYGPVTLYLTTT